MSIEINLKQAVVKLSKPTNEIRMLSDQGPIMKITKCRQDEQGRVYITVEIEKRKQASSSRKKTSRVKKAKQKTQPTRKSKDRKKGFNKLLGEIL